MSLDEFSAALHGLYSAASDPSCWPEALRGLEDLTGSAGATLNFVPRRPNGAGFVLAGRFTADLCAEYARDYMMLCPRVAYTMCNDPDIAYDAMMLTEREMDRDPVYHWFATLGLRYHVGSSLGDVSEHQALFSFQRTARQGHVQAGDIALYARLRDHIGQAVRLAHEFGTLRTQQQFSLAMLDGLPQGIIIIGDRAEILFANFTADRILAGGSGLCVRNGALEAVLPAERKAFVDLLRRAIGVAKGGIDSRLGASGWLRLSRGEGQPPFAVFVAPLAGDPVLGTVGQPAVAVFVHETAAATRASTIPMLAALYGLTPTESQLAALLAGGETLANAADTLGHSIGTARIHLKVIFRKMELGRQQELVGLVARLTAASPYAAA